MPSGSATKKEWTKYQGESGCILNGIIFCSVYTEWDIWKQMCHSNYSNFNSLLNLILYIHIIILSHIAWLAYYKFILFVSETLLAVNITFWKQFLSHRWCFITRTCKKWVLHQPFPGERCNSHFCEEQRSCFFVNTHSPGIKKTSQWYLPMFTIR